MTLGKILASMVFLLLAALPCSADTTVRAVKVRVLFTPGDNVAAGITQAIRSAKRNIRIQAFSFTNKVIARALQEASRRGVEVKLLADRDQFDRGAGFLLRDLKHAGVNVMLDGQHGAAHNKIMLIDPDGDNPTIITGSFNFTQAAQKFNAENVVLIHDDRALASAYYANWQRHWQHGIRFE
jgi:phosphatidylserine/phosphatidylglycerophosphate/cardiolipin synthase-like enzyme